MSQSTRRDPDELRETVRRKYSEIASGGKNKASAATCCGSDDPQTEIKMVGEGYGSVEGYVEDADLGLGCGIPTDHADLESGQTVVDLGSGAGLDAFVARRIVGERGRVIGVDFSADMVQKARANTKKLGFENVTFVEGDIEDLPLDDNSADVVLSNCVLNLVPDKERAFREIHRILRPGGHFCISDIVARGVLPEAIRQSAELYAGCVSGAMDEDAYLDLIQAAGFAQLEVRDSRPINVPDEEVPDGISEAERAALDEGGLWSITLRGTKAGG